ncbi:MAG: hypothetical protein J6P61_08280 [Erysipelotrichaceae bacterium]|nr:hypothetical protein [Erysipelotrichaceae bacterium]
MENEIRRVVLVSLAGVLLGWMLFLFGITISNHAFIVDLMYYLIATLLFVAAFLALRASNKKSKQNINLYLMGLIILFEAFITFYLISTHI